MSGQPERTDVTAAIEARKKPGIDERHEFHLRLITLIEEYGLPAVLRAITAFARVKYETRSAERVSAFTGGQIRSFLDEPTPEERKKNDIACAWLGVDLNYVADRFEQAMADAGMSDAELRERDRRKAIAEHEAEIARLKARAL